MDETAITDGEYVAIIETLRRQVDALRSALEDIQFNDCCYETRLIADVTLEGLGDGVQT